MIFNQGSQVGKQHIDEKFLKNRNCSSTREFLHGKAAFQLLIFGFDWPAIKIKFLKHYLRDEWIEKVGSEIFFRAVIKSDFNDTNINVCGTVLGIAWKKGIDIARAFFCEVVSFLEAHKTKMPMLHTVAEKNFRIITTVEDDNAVLINVERFQIFQMFHGSSTFRSKKALERGMNEVVVKDIVNDGSKTHGEAPGRIRITEHFAEEFKIGRRVWKLNFGAIDGKKMVTMPESAGRKLTVQ